MPLGSENDESGSRYRAGQELLSVIISLTEFSGISLTEIYISWQSYIKKNTCRQRAGDMQVIPGQCFALHLIANKRSVK